MAELKVLNEHKLPNYIPFEIDEKVKKNHINMNINGIEIHFPYEIYKTQIKYMENVISLLNNKIYNSGDSIGAFESPTGTGKTLCLLCSTLAWMNEMRKQKKFGGKILYTTRTHSQITQIIHELQKTCYRPRTAILSSRDNSCVNDNIKKNTSGTILNIKCRKFCKKCAYYNGVKTNLSEKFNLLDIEDLCKSGRNFEFCPFYQQIEKAKNYSDIVFMPYNYIFDEDISSIMEIDIRNNIIIIDEAHNVRKVCEDSKSVEIKSNDFDDIIKDLDNLLNYDQNLDIIENVFKFEKKSKKKKSPLTDISKNDINSEKNAIIEIKNRFNNPEIKIDYKGKKITYMEFFNIFMTKEERKYNKKKRKKKLNYKDDELSCDSNSLNISEDITISNIKDHITFLNKVNLSFQDYFEKGSKISILLKIFNIISQLVDDINLQQSYNFYIVNEKKKYNKDTNENEYIDDNIRKFNIFCFSPKIEFNDILKNDPFSIILTSGTLTPFKIYEDELQIKLNSTLENDHMVSKDQFLFEIITNYSENGKYRFDYNNRNNVQMIKSLGNEICNYCRKTPYGGILVFFSSYIYLNQCNNLWNELGINNNIKIYKKIYIDSPNNKNLVNQIKKDSNKNYVLFSVFRGSSSEGIDFTDDSARVVICVGIPFADITENRVKLKIEYLNNINKDKEKKIDFIEGKEWYVADAMIAVNQSLGRVIRHINDYGVMVCIDERYKNYENYFSSWIKNNYLQYNDNSNINKFFNEQREKFKDYIKNNSKTSSLIDSKKSGFNSVINNDKYEVLKNKDKINEKEFNKKSKTNIKKDMNISSNDMDIESSDESIDNSNINNNIKDSEKENLTQIYELPKLSGENINTLNVKEIAYKTNYNEILNSILSKKPDEENKKKKNNKNIEIYEKWDVTRNNNNNKIYYKFDKEQKETIELLESINEFLNNNPKEFNNILNKYK